MMQPADNWHLDHSAKLRRLDLPLDRRVLVEREVGSEILIVIDVRSQLAFQRSFVEDDHVVQALSPDGTDQALRERILPGALRRGLDLFDAHCLHAVPTDLAIDSIPIVQQESRRRLPRKRLANLLSRPFRCGMRRNVEMKCAAAVVGQYDEDKQDSKCQSRHDEKVHGDDLPEMVVEGCAPGL